jgi:hypothetical protein
MVLVHTYLKVSDIECVHRDDITFKGKYGINALRKVCLHTVYGNGSFYFGFCMYALRGYEQVHGFMSKERAVTETVPSRRPSYDIVVLQSQSSL